MAPNQEVVSVLKAYVDTGEGGMVAVGHGEPLPSDAVAGEAERLRELGALGVLAPPATGDTVDEVDALTASLTEAAITDYVGSHTIKEIVAAVGEDAELARKVLTAEQDATGGEPRKSLVAALDEIAGEPDEAASTEDPPATDDTVDEG